ncbi:MAG: hypothetical protein ACOC22_03120 [bacterium]
MKKIQAIKVGNTVNLSINGKLHKKNCGSPEEANELFSLALKAKDNPTDENVKRVRAFLNEKLRVAMYAGLETDVENGEVFLAGFNTPIPITLVEVIKEYHENGFPMHPIINFWKLLMVNPDKRVRESLFNFITTHDFVLTDNGYMVTYKAVYEKNEMCDDAQLIQNKYDQEYADFLAEKFNQVKTTWKANPNKYVVYRDNDDKTYSITKVATAMNWDEDEKGIEILGKLGELYESVVVMQSKINHEPEQLQLFTDMHSRTMKIELGKPVKMERGLCDSDPEIDCSSGLHVGATKYVESFAGKDSKILVCYVNPANVVAVPKYDHSKMRVSEYFPFALAKFENRKIEIIDEPYFESDYQNMEIDELEKLIEKVKKDEKPFEAARNSVDEERPMSELMKMLENRLLDVNSID